MDRFGDHPRLEMHPDSEASCDDGFSLDPIVERLCDPAKETPILSNPGWSKPPSREVVAQIVGDLRSVLFPGYFGATDLNPENYRYHTGATLDRVLRLLEDQIKRGLCFYCTSEHPGRCQTCASDASRVARAFLERLPDIQSILATDAVAAYEGDPAATSVDEAIFCYPGLLAITSFRIAHELNSLGVPLIPRIVTEHAHSLTGVDIHPAAEIGEGLFIDHGTGVVIGETCNIGNRVRIYQGVTLGAKSFPRDEDGHAVKGILRHPRIESDVVIYAGATILGRVTVGRGSQIGGNVWLTRSVPPGSRISQAQVRSDVYAGGGGI